VSGGGLGRLVRRALAAGWRALRLWSGDAAYDVYVRRSGGAPRLSREAFYLETIRRRYERPNRCC
jgi:uncharacterized short protein YbdD (DUF466 family)